MRRAWAHAYLLQVDGPSKAKDRHANCVQRSEIMCGISCSLFCQPPASLQVPYGASLHTNPDNCSTGPNSLAERNRRCDRGGSRRNCLIHTSCSYIRYCTSRGSTPWSSVPGCKRYNPRCCWRTPTRSGIRSWHTARRLADAHPTALHICWRENQSCCTTSPCRTLLPSRPSATPNCHPKR